MSTPDVFTGFSPATLTFLRGLSKNNSKEWFESRRETYEREIKRPMQRFVEEIDDRLARIALASLQIVHGIARSHTA